MEPYKTFRRPTRNPFPHCKLQLLVTVLIGPRDLRRAYIWNVFDAEPGSFFLLGRVFDRICVHVAFHTVQTSTLLLNKHVPDARPVLRGDMLLDLFLRKPLELFQIICVVFEISLASKYSCLHEERLFSINVGGL